MTKKPTRLRITTSLLNSWRYIWLSADNVREFDSDTESLEDKIDKTQKRAYDSFIAYLKREPFETTEAMQKGIDFEEDCYNGLTPFSEIIEKGIFQAKGQKLININGVEFQMFGILDVLKGGIIYDIKRTSQYKVQKYQKSYQHAFYFYLFPNAKQFTYLVYDGKSYHQETYFREDCVDIKEVIWDFYCYLKDNNLLEIYEEHWKEKEFIW